MLLEKEPQDPKEQKQYLSLLRAVTDGIDNVNNPSVKVTLECLFDIFPDWLRYKTPREICRLVAEATKTVVGWDFTNDWFVFSKEKPPSQKSVPRNTSYPDYKIP